ncbi:uncharacterized protein MP3633_0807 [Marinomonas primoryensis]|uniref:Uncharacterized protein n=1 Tax=Marinomonas primoryensis TaxID=178399 RepID=A0A859CTF2_9GAMM|nr:uncharacterized protein MP3633_0807 [Marinomonas primoryensis]
MLRAFFLAKFLVTQQTARSLTLYLATYRLIDGMCIFNDELMTVNYAT